MSDGGGGAPAGRIGRECNTTAQNLDKEGSRSY